MGVHGLLLPPAPPRGAEADYQSLQEFLADSTWDAELLLRAVAERVAPRIGVAAWEAPRAPLLADAGYGDNTAFRGALHEAGLEYLVAVSPETCRRTLKHVASCTTKHVARSG
jgi:SRSO17 transposase